MYENAKMIPVETVPGIGRGDEREQCKYHNVPPLIMTIIKNKIK
jgi:hypothetical protein